MKEKLFSYEERDEEREVVFLMHIQATFYEQSWILYLILLITILMSTTTI